MGPLADAIQTPLNIQEHYWLNPSLLRQLPKYAAVVVNRNRSRIEVSGLEDLSMR